TALLGGLDALLNGMRQVRSASADVGAEHVGSVALVVHTDSQWDGLVLDGGWVTPDVDGLSSNWWQEDLSRHTIAARTKREVTVSKSFQNLDVGICDCCCCCCGCYLDVRSRE